VGYVKVSRCELPVFLEMWEEIETLRADKVSKPATDEFDYAIAWLWEIGIQEVQVVRILGPLVSFLVSTDSNFCRTIDGFLTFYPFSTPKQYKRA
jgi:hypothetical protein